MFAKSVTSAIAGMVVISAVFTAVAADPPPTIPPRVSFNPSVVNNGHVILVELDTHGDSASVQLSLNHKFIPLSEYPVMGEGFYFALIGIPYYSKKGQAQLKLNWSDSAGTHETLLPFDIQMGQYRSERLKVNPAKVTPSKSALERIKKERKQIKAVYAGWHFSRLWTEPFIRPLQSQVTSPFGSRRLFNGKTKSYHSGVDFRAPVGTPVFASNAGIVKMAQDLFYSGNIVIIDHGMAVFTLYAHLSRMDVNPGQWVDRGEQIGLTGATGRVNGPHLHWSAKINGVTVTPLDLIERLEALYAAPQTRMVSKEPVSPPKSLDN